MRPARRPIGTIDATTSPMTWTGVTPIALRTANSRVRWRVSRSTVLNTPPSEIATRTAPSAPMTLRNTRNEVSLLESPTTLTSTLLPMDSRKAVARARTSTRSAGPSSQAAGWTPGWSVARSANVPRTATFR